MRLTIAPVPIEFGRLTVQIRDPGIVRHVAFERKQTLVMAAGRPEFREVPVIFVEASPEGPIRKRTFECIRQGQVLELADDEQAIWRASNISGGGMVVHVFELMETPQ